MIVKDISLGIKFEEVVIIVFGLDVIVCYSLILSFKNDGIVVEFFKE